MFFATYKSHIRQNCQNIIQRLFMVFIIVFQLINTLIFFYPNKEGIVEFVFAQLNVWVIKASVQDSHASEILTFMVELCTSAAHSADRMQMQS